MHVFISLNNLSTVDSLVNNKMYLKGLLLLVLLLIAVTTVDSKKSKHTKSTKGSKSKKSKSSSRSSDNDGGAEDQNMIIEDNPNPAIIADVNSAVGVRPGASVTLNGMIIEPYTQLMSTTLFNGILQCDGGTSAVNAMWVLPNGMSTSFMNLMVRHTSDRRVELLKVDSSLPVGINGVFWCSIEYEAYTDMIPIVIEDTPRAPSITAQSCQFSGFNPMDGSFGVYLTANVSDGSPTTVTCSLTHHNSQPTLLSGRIYRQIHESQSPVMTGIQVLVNVPTSSVPSSISCSISNTQGSSRDTLSCDIQSSSSSLPSITSVVRDIQVSSMAKVNWSPVTSGEYMVYVSSSSARDYIPFQQIQVTDSEATITGLYPGHSYQVFVAASSSSTQSGNNKIILPSISQTFNIPMSKCKPAQGQNIEIILNKVNEDCEEAFQCTGLTMNEKQELAMSAVTSCGTGQWNCTVMEPKVTKVYCNNNEKTPKKKKHSSTKGSSKYGDIKVKAMAVCEACTFGLDEDKKTPRRRNRRAHAPRQLNGDCTLTFMGCQYTASINTKYDPIKVCGYKSMSSSIESCDCPDQCFQTFSRTCTNSCSCSA